LVEIWRRPFFVKSGPSSDENLFLVQTLRNAYLDHCNIPNHIFNGGHSSSQSVGVNVGKSVGVPPGGTSSLPENGSNISRKAFGEKNLE
jgi:hypothetical protein